MILCVCGLSGEGGLLCCITSSQVNRELWQEADMSVRRLRTEASALELENTALLEQMKVLQAIVAGAVPKEEVFSSVIFTAYHADSPAVTEECTYCEVSVA